MPLSTSTSHWFDFAALREAVLTEKAIRNCTITEMGEVTGISQMTLSRFLNRNVTVDIHAAASLAVWCGGSLSGFVKRRKTVRRHVDTAEQRQFRTAATFLATKGIIPAAGESAIDAMVRYIGELESRNA